MMNLLWKRGFKKPLEAHDCVERLRGWERQRLFKVMGVHDAREVEISCSSLL